METTTARLVKSGRPTQANTPTRARWSVVAWCAGAIAVAGCVRHGTTRPQATLIYWNRPVSYLGEKQGIDYLARGFLPLGQREPEEFGYYVYLIFQPEASDEQKLSAAEAFLAHPEATNYQQLQTDTKRGHWALMLAPVLSVREPLNARQLVDDYDAMVAQVVTREVQRAGRKLPAVALVAHRKPIVRDAGLSKSELFVGDACGRKPEVREKFRRLRAGLVQEDLDDTFVLRLAAVLGRILTDYSTQPCL